MTSFRSGHIRLLLVMSGYTTLTGGLAFLPLPWFLISVIVVGAGLSRYARHLLTWIVKHDQAVARDVVEKWTEALIEVASKPTVQPLVIVVPKGTEEIQH